MLLMTIKSILKEVEDLIRALKNKDTKERAVSYQAILALLGGIEESVKDQSYPNYPIYKDDLVKACEKLCTLTDHGGVEEAQCIGGALATVRKMGSYTCFNVDNHYI